MNLPSPITVTDHYLEAIHGVLGEIRDRLPKPKQNETGQTNVSEPGKPAAKRATRGTDTKIKEN